MDTTDEQAFRALLDDAGILRPGTLAAPDGSEAFTVFAQRSDAALDIEVIRRHGERFFGLKLGLTVDKRYRAGAAPPAIDAARIVIASASASEDVGGTRLCFGRPATDRDQAAAEAAERIQNTTGMALLARRCRVVWLVTCAPTSGDDRVALAISAVLAGVFLGPILTPRGDALVGVKTARSRLASAT